MTQRNLSTKQKQTHRHREQTYGCQRGGSGGMDWNFGISRCKLLYIERINNKDLWYSTGNYIQYPVINHNGKEYDKECICREFPGGAVVKNLPANAGDTGLSPGPGRSHMLWSN